MKKDVRHSRNRPLPSPIRQGIVELGRVEEITAKGGPSKMTDGGGVSGHDRKDTGGGAGE